MKPATPFFVGSMAIYAASATPAIGDIIGFLLIPFLAPILLTLGMILLIFQAVSKTSPLLTLLVPLCYFGYGAGLALDGHQKVSAARDQVARYNAAQPEMSFAVPPQSLAIFKANDRSGITANSMITRWRLRRVVQIHEESGKARLYSAEAANGNMLSKNESARNIFYTSLPDRNGIRAHIRSSPAAVPRSGLRITQTSAAAIPYLKDGQFRVYEIRRAGQSAGFMHGSAKIPDGIMFPIVMRGALGGGGTSSMEFRLMGSNTVSLDPDGMSEGDRLASILNLKPQDFSRLN